MAPSRSIPKEGHYVVGIFHDADKFVTALETVLAAGFDRAAVSILADHEAVKDHFGTIPDADAMADRPDTPREDLDDEGAVRKAVRFIAESVAIIGEIGAAGMAFAVGGPVGVASAAATSADLSINDVLMRNVHEQYHARFEDSVRDGGVICWVHVRDAAERKKATDALKGAGGEHVHETDL